MEEYLVPTDFGEDEFYEKTLDIFVDGENLSELLLSVGLAEVKYIYGDYKYVDNLCKLQETAIKEKELAQPYGYKLLPSSVTEFDRYVIVGENGKVYIEKLGEAKRRIRIER